MSNLSDHIRIWRFSDAPLELRNACHHNGGDEDWLAVVPQSVAAEGAVTFLESSSFDSCGQPQRYVIDQFGDIYWFPRHSDDGGSDGSQVQHCGYTEHFASCDIYVGTHG